MFGISLDGLWAMLVFTVYCLPSLVLLEELFALTQKEHDSGSEGQSQG